MIMLDFDEDGPMPRECAHCERESQDARMRPVQQVLCESCWQNYCEAAFEAEQDTLRNAASPQTMAEQWAQAAAAKVAGRR